MTRCSRPRSPRSSRVHASRSVAAGSRDRSPGSDYATLGFALRAAEDPLPADLRDVLLLLTGPEGAHQMIGVTLQRAIKILETLNTRQTIHDLAHECLDSRLRNVAYQQDCPQGSLSGKPSTGKDLTKFGGS